MSGPAGASPSAAPTDSAGIRCIECGYDLSGTAVGAVCPECGRRVADSLMPVRSAGHGAAKAALIAGIATLVALPPLGFLAVHYANRFYRLPAAARADPSSAFMARAGWTLGVLGIIATCFVGGIGLLLLVFSPLLA